MASTQLGEFVLDPATADGSSRIVYSCVGLRLNNRGINLFNQAAEKTGGIEFIIFDQGVLNIVVEDAVDPARTMRTFWKKVRGLLNQYDDPTSACTGEFMPGIAVSSDSVLSLSQMSD